MSDYALWVSDPPAAPPQAGASLATGTERTSALALAPIKPMPVRHGRKKDGFGAVGMEEAVLTATRTWSLRLSD
jgi:hypothetical protein